MRVAWVWCRACLSTMYIAALASFCLVVTTSKLARSHCVSYTSSLILIHDGIMFQVYKLQCEHVSWNELESYLIDIPEFDL